jgi:predicted aspartyl protease
MVGCTRSTIRAEFTISNRIYTMPVELLVDSGAQSELKLPSRKVLQLGLRPFGPPTTIRGTTNHTSMVTKFSPVLVNATFNRNGVLETVENYLDVRCDKNGYDALITANVVPQMAHTGNQPREPDSPPPMQQRSNTTVVATPTGTDAVPITEIRLSPIDRPEEQAVIGIGGLKKLRLHLNCERRKSKKRRFWRRSRCPGQRSLMDRWLSVTSFCLCEKRTRPLLCQNFQKVP